MLGLPEDSDRDAVRERFLKLAKKLHPDSGHPQANAEQFQVVRTVHGCFVCLFVLCEFDGVNKCIKKSISS